MVPEAVQGCGGDHGAVILVTSRAEGTFEVATGSDDAATLDGGRARNNEHKLLVGGGGDGMRGRRVRSHRRFQADGWHGGRRAAARLLSGRGLPGGANAPLRRARRGRDGFDGAAPV